MKDMSAVATGTVTGFLNNEIVVVLETKFGKTFLDNNSGLPISFNIGDSVQVETESFYIMNGQIVYCIDNESDIVIDGWRIKLTEQKTPVNFEPGTMGDLLLKAQRSQT